MHEIGDFSAGLPPGDAPPDAGSAVEEADRIVRATRLVHTANEIGRQRYAIGIELLPDEMRGVLTDVDGHRLAVRWLPLPSMDVQVVADTAKTLVDRLVAVAGLSVPSDRVVLCLQLGGPVDARTGRVISYRKESDRGPVRWADEDLAERLRQTAGVSSAIVVNDGEALAMRELWAGAGRSSFNFLVLLVRQGVGGGLVLYGRVARVPMEIGQLPVRLDAGGPLCDCGRRGCLEITAGTTGIVDRIQELTGRKLPGIVAAAELADDAEPDLADKALDSFGAAGSAMAHGIGTAITLLRPDRVVIYAPEVMVGGDGAASRMFRNKLEDFGKHVSHEPFRHCLVDYRPFEPFDGAEGAAYTALTDLLGVPPRGAATKPPHRETGDGAPR